MSETHERPMWFIPGMMSASAAVVWCVPAERCEECGFDGDSWSDTAAIDAISELPARWKNAISGLSDEELGGRPIPDMWSIAEYVDHVREVLFGMRFVLDSAVAEPGVDLGEAPESRFEPVPREVHLGRALAGVEFEAYALRDRLTEFPAAAWDAIATVGTDEVDAHWIARHAVHDATHHLLDVQRLREAL